MVVIEGIIIIALLVILFMRGASETEMGLKMKCELLERALERKEREIKDAYFRGKRDMVRAFQRKHKKQIRDAK